MTRVPGRFRRRAWRAWYGVRWRVWQHRDADRVRTRLVRGLRVTVVPGVLDPAWFFSSEVLVDALEREVRAGERVLDLGTGTGIGALAALRAGAGQVVATDLDPAAAACARGNLVVAGDRVEVRIGDLFQPVAGERFDLVAFNPPWLTGVEDARHGMALRLDPQLPDRFAEALVGHLAPAGRALLLTSTNGDPGAWLDPLRRAGHHVAAMIERDRGSEVISAWRVTPPDA